MMIYYVFLESISFKYILICFWPIRTDIPQENLTIHITKVFLNFSNGQSLIIMAGRRHKDFRSGDLSEELGILLTKGIAAVATVARPEDVGVDAIATLLCDGGKGLLIAENSFYIQYKSSSKRIIRFKGHEVRWLEKLKLPFFIGSVNRDESTMDLYPSHSLSMALLESQYKEVKLLLHKPRKSKPCGGTIREVYIGPPLLSWSTGDMTKSEFAPKAYSVLKPYLVAEQRNIDYRGIRYLEFIHWETGELPRCEQGNMVFHDPKDELLPVIRSMAPYFYVLASRALSDKDKYAMETVFRLGEYMRACGFDPDPKRCLQVMWQHWMDFSRGEENSVSSETCATNHPPE
jgi:hypothetical protein